MDEKDSIQKLSELIKGIKFAMLTTVDADGSLSSRPMTTQEQDFAGTLWFFAQASSQQAQDIQKEQHVNVAYAAPDDQRYVSVSGTAEVVKDRKKAEELWNPIFKAYFPGGLDDPELALLKIDVHQAEYWDAPSSKAVRLFKFVKGAVTGTHPHMGEHEKVDLHK